MDPRTATAKSSNAFMQIYTAAKNDDRIALLGIFKTLGSVDVKDEVRLFTPAARLASEGLHDAVELLRTLGASDDYIAMGYASKGFIKEAEDLRVRVGIKLKYLAVGAAMHVDSQYAEQLRKAYGLRPEWLVLGASYAKHHDYVHQLMQLETTKAAREAAVLAQVNGYSLVGEDGLVKEIIDQYRPAFTVPVTDEELKELSEPERYKIEMSQLFKEIICGEYSDEAKPQSITSYCKILKSISVASDTNLTIESDKRNLKFGSRLNKIEDKADPAEILSEVSVSSHFYTKELLTYALAFVDMDMLKRFTESVVNFDNTEHDVVREFKLEDCINQAVKINQCMTQYGFNYDMAAAFIKSSDLQNLLKLTLDCDQGAKTKYLENYWLESDLLTIDTLRVMTDLYKLSIAKEFACKQLDSYTASVWNGSHAERVASFKYAISKTTTQKELRDLSFRQFGMFAGTIKGTEISAAPKHEQAVKNLSQGTLYVKLEETFVSKLLNK